MCACSRARSSVPSLAGATFQGQRVCGEAARAAVLRDQDRRRDRLPHPLHRRGHVSRRRVLYGQVGLMRKKGTKHWIKFLDLEDNEKISEELHPLELAGYYDEWFFVERV
jgi:hypothetical protein